MHFSLCRKEVIVDERVDYVVEKVCPPEDRPKKLEGIAVGDRYMLGGHPFYIDRINVSRVALRPVTEPGGESARAIIEQLQLKR